MSHVPLPRSSSDHVLGEFPAGQILKMTKFLSFLLNELRSWFHKTALTIVTGGSKCS